MLLLDTALDLSIYKTTYLIKIIIYLICILTPLIIIIKSTMDIIANANSTKQLKEVPLTILRRILIGLIIFLIPTLITNIINILSNENIENNKYFVYYKDASSQKIDELQKKYDQEEKERINLEKAKEKELYTVIARDVEIQKEQSEEVNENNNDDNSNSTNNDSNNDNNSSNEENNEPSAGKEVLVDPSTGDGTYGSVTVKNGVFYIPNKRATSNADTPTLSGKYGLNPVFWERLNKFINDASKQGYRITVTSALRPYSKQARLWNNSSRSCSTRSKWVACPGGSRHGWGIAADLKYNGKSCSDSNWNCNSAAKWAHSNASKYLLKYRMSWEPWHIEPSQVKGGSYGKCTAKC